MLNLAVGGNFVGNPNGSTTFPATMQVDYVRAYEAAPANILIDVPTGASQSQSDAGYARILSAAEVRKQGGGELVFTEENSYSGPTLVEAGRLRLAAGRALVGSPTIVTAGGTLTITTGLLATLPKLTLAGGILEADRLFVGTTGIPRLDVVAGVVMGGPSLTVEAGGRVTLPTGSRVSLAAGSLVVAETWDGGLVDLGAGEIVIAPGGISAADLRADLLAGRNGGTWTGTSGISSTAAAASIGGARTLGYLTEASGAIRISYAAPGDTNLDGSVSVFDLVSVSGSGTYGTGGSSVWAQGDFTYDGVTNVFDLVAVGGGDAYGRGSYFPQASATAVAPVPEPAVSAWFAAILAGVAMAHRNRS
jgi:autotransporter-associated beta strand protein